MINIAMCAYKLITTSESHSQVIEIFFRAWDAYFRSCHNISFG